METNAKLPVIKLTLAFIFAQVSAQQQQKKQNRKGTGKSVSNAAATRLMKTNGSQERVHLWQERDGEKQREKDRKLIAFPLIYL